MGFLYIISIEKIVTISCCKSLMETLCRRRYQTAWENCFLRDDLATPKSSPRGLKNVESRKKNYLPCTKIVSKQ